MKLEQLAAETLSRWFRAVFQIRRFGAQRGLSSFAPHVESHPKEPIPVEGRSRRRFAQHAFR